MYQLVESVYLRDGVFRNLPYHENRMRKSQSKLFDKNITIPLGEYLNSLNPPLLGLFKVRLIYDSEIRKVEFVPYVAKTIQSIRLVHSEAVKYEYKFLDRSELNSLYEQRGSADEILLVRNGFITDASYANVVFRKSGVWYTPRHYLLAGTMRQYLLDTKRIREAVIDSKNYRNYESLKLINSMLGMEGSEIPIESIQ
jgi:4-amino-4-deoxychorismate lyase